MIAPAEDIATILQAETSLVLGTDLFIGKEPAEPNSCVTVFDTHGSPSALALDGSLYQNPAIQLRVRGVNQLTVSTLCQTLLDLLDGMGNTSVGSTTYMIIEHTSGPSLLDWDENDRCRFVINFNMKRKE